MTHLNMEDRIEQLLQEDELNPPSVEWNEDFPEPVERGAGEI